MHVLKQVDGLFEDLLGLRAALWSQNSALPAPGPWSGCEPLPQREGEREREGERDRERDRETERQIAI